MTLTSDHARLDGRVVATDLDRALELLEESERARSEAAALLGGPQGSELERFLGYVSWERLVAHRSGCGNRAAFDLIRIARHLHRFEETAQALADGRLGLAAAGVLAKTASGLTAASELDESELLEVAATVELEELERICRLWRARADAEAATTHAQHRWEQRGVWLHVAFDGSCTGRVALDAIGTEVVAAALETRPDSTNSMADPRTAAQRRADRLVDVCTIARGGVDGSDGGGGTRANVDVVIDIPTLAGADGPIERIRADLDHGGPITGPGLDRLLCDTSFRALITTIWFHAIEADRRRPRTSPCCAASITVSSTTEAGNSLGHQTARSRPARPDPERPAARGRSHVRLRVAARLEDEPDRRLTPALASAHQSRSSQVSWTRSQRTPFGPAGSMANTTVLSRSLVAALSSWRST